MNKLWNVHTQDHIHKVHQFSVKNTETPQTWHQSVKHRTKHLLSFYSMLILLFQKKKKGKIYMNFKSIQNSSICLLKSLPMLLKLYYNYYHQKLS